MLINTDQLCDVLNNMPKHTAVQVKVNGTNRKILGVNYVTTLHGRTATIVLEESNDTPKTNHKNLEQVADNAIKNAKEAFREKFGEQPINEPGTWKIYYHGFIKGFSEGYDVGVDSALGKILEALNSLPPMSS